MRCRLGDVAIVIRDDECPENIGRYVVVERLATAHPFEAFHTGPLWLVRAREPFSIFDPRDGYRGECLDGYTPDDCLQPIRGQRQPEPITTTAPELAEV